MKPTQSMQHIGMVINTVKMQTQLPSEKKGRMIDLGKENLERKEE